MNTQVNQVALSQAVTEALKSVRYPGYSRDIVSFGFVRGDAVERGVVIVELGLHAVKEPAAAQIQVESERVLNALPLLSGLDSVTISGTGRPCCLA
jgi:ATP-binding protein involved in chromosome partitioning